ncbi:hypothetical protein BLNAU_12373 [Blattamonas nauphoetae]|uniref:Uncharacterized protein n=1 Tax=Blattamonas nauphoetae TaxID=2049346 RepID=A0ABQ9XMI4_9EUKA|nr:hypothetical protein BLNAU_12373 [Blattamonas nauphoetae]
MTKRNEDKRKVSSETLSIPQHQVNGQTPNCVRNRLSVIIATQQHPSTQPAIHHPIPSSPTLPQQPTSSHPPPSSSSTRPVSSLSIAISSSVSAVGSCSAVDSTATPVLPAVLQSSDSIDTWSE